MLLLAFLCVGVSACFVTALVLNKNQEREACEALSGYAAVFASQISGDQHVASQTPTVTGANTLGAVQRKIQAAAKHFPSVQSIYTVVPHVPRTVDAEYRRAIQFLGEVPEEQNIPASPVLRRVFSTASPATILVDSGSGPTPTAYIPLLAKRQPVAVLVVEGASPHPNLFSLTWTALGVILAALLLASVTCTAVITRKILASAGASAWTRSIRAITRAIRNPALEFLLVAATVAILSSGFQAVNKWQEASKELHVIELRIDRFEDLIRVLQRDYMGRSVPHHALAQEAASLGLADYVAGLTRERGHRDMDYPVLMKQIHVMVADARFSRDLVKQEQESNELTAKTTLWIAGLMVLGSLILIRIAAGQQADLESAELDSARLQGAYSQVAENLPIGLFSYQGHSLKFTNKVWDQLTNRFPFENRMEALLRSLHPEDVGRLKAALEQGEKSRQPFDIQYRLMTTDGKERSIESRAVPILDPDGHLDYLLGFGLDVTAMAEAQKQLELRNKEVSAKNSQLHKALTDIEDNFEAMVHSLVKAVEAKDPYTAGHSERVMGYSVRIGEEIGLPAKQLRILERGALVHDIGKIGVPDALLTKPSALTDEEFSIVKQHPMIGFRMIQGIPIFHECVPIVLWHHERLDGKGYPDRLSGDQIPLLVRITAVADCFDAMTSNRAYRKGMDVERALNLLRKDAAGGALDPEIVEVLVKVVHRDGLLWQATDIPAA